MKRFSLMNSAAVLALVATGAMAQDDDDAVNVPTEEGGDIVVEQDDAIVDVDVPDPDVEVDQMAPEVTVEMSRSTAPKMPMWRSKNPIPASTSKAVEKVTSI
ncbi:MAG: hypothetical protein LC676_05225 [Loktanella sp.]|nr:hypothetical protein [Loktanella sp.]